MAELLVGIEGAPAAQIAEIPVLVVSFIVFLLQARRIAIASPRSTLIARMLRLRTEVIRRVRP